MKKKLSLLVALTMMLGSMAGLAEEAKQGPTEAELLAKPCEFSLIEANGEQPRLTYIEGVTPILEVDGYKFKDLNKNGELDPYEDWRLTPEERTEDLLSRMSDKNKAAQMAHMTLVTLKESWFSDLDIGFALTYTYFAESKESAGEKMNYVQSLCEESELGIPVSGSNTILDPGISY